MKIVPHAFGSVLTGIKP